MTNGLCAGGHVAVAWSQERQNSGAFVVVTGSAADCSSCCIPGETDPLASSPSVPPPTAPVSPPTATVSPPTAPANPPTAPVNPPTAPVNPPTSGRDPRTPWVDPARPPQRTVEQDIARVMYMTGETDPDIVARYVAGDYSVDSNGDTSPREIEREQHVCSSDCVGNAQKQPIREETLSMARAVAYEAPPSLDFNIVSAVRSAGYQQYLWNRKFDSYASTPGYSRTDALFATLEMSALPSASRHHWGTDVDFNSVETEDFLPGARYHSFSEYMKVYARIFGLCLPYNEGRDQGFQPEAWHWSERVSAAAMMRMWLRDPPAPPSTVHGLDVLPEDVAPTYVRAINTDCLDDVCDMCSLRESYDYGFTGVTTRSSGEGRYIWCQCCLHNCAGDFETRCGTKYDAFCFSESPELNLAGAAVTQSVAGASIDQTCVVDETEASDVDAVSSQCGAATNVVLRISSLTGSFSAERDAALFADTLIDRAASLVSAFAGKQVSLGVEFGEGKVHFAHTYALGAFVEGMMTNLPASLAGVTLIMHDEADWTSRTTAMPLVTSTSKHVHVWAEPADNRNPWESTYLADHLTRLAEAVHATKLYVRATSTFAHTISGRALLRMAAERGIVDGVVPIVESSQVATVATVRDSLRSGSPLGDEAALRVDDTTGDSSGISAGAITGIVAASVIVACCCCAALGVGAMFFISRRREEASKSLSPSSTRLHPTRRRGSVASGTARPGRRRVGSDARSRSSSQHISRSHEEGGSLRAYGF